MNNFLQKKIALIIFVSIFLLSNFFIINKIIALSNISDTDKYAWGDILGWVNFNPTNGNVTVSHSNITGYAWSQNYGWINLSPTNGGILNNGIGDLSGSAWGDSIGWINFDNVSIDNAGRFIGVATTESNGSINFNCVNCVVSTAWTSGAISADFVDSLGNQIGSPIFQISNTNFDINQKTISGVIGDSDNKIRIVNTTSNPLWTVSLSATNGSDSLWDNGSGQSYKFNGPDLEGNMEIDPTLMNVSGAGVLKGSKQKFLKDTVDSVTIAYSDNSSISDTIFDLENIGINQIIPASQSSGTYGLDIMLTIIQN